MPTPVGQYWAKSIFNIQSIFHDSSQNPEEIEPIEVWLPAVTQMATRKPVRLNTFALNLDVNPQTPFLPHNESPLPFN